jgi:hypothetical protein
MVALALACRVSTVGPITFEPFCSPQGAASEVVSADTCAAIGALAVTDGRSGDGVVGTRTIQNREGRADISIEGGVEDWLRGGVERALDAAAIRRGAGPDVTVRLMTLTLNEVAFRNSEFNGRVALEVTVARAGAEPWSFIASGEAENYGRPGNTANYQETANHALDRVATSAVNNTEFRRRLCPQGLARARQRPSDVERT